MNPLPSTLAAYAHHAEAQLPAEVWNYLQDGDSRSQLTHQAAFDAMALLPRPLADVRGANTRIELFGRTYAHPLMQASIAYQRLFHAQGEVGIVMAAQAQQAVMLVSSLASQPTLPRQVLMPGSSSTGRPAAMQRCACCARPRMRAHRRSCSRSMRR